MARLAKLNSVGDVVVDLDTKPVQPRKVKVKKEPSLEELRALAMGAWEDHKRDMKNDPAYRAEVVRKYGKDRLKDAE